MRGAVVGLLLIAAFVLSGCQYLLGGMMGGPIVLPGGTFDPGEFGSFDPGDFGSFDPNDPQFSIPPPTTTYTKGSATVTIDGKANAMPSLSGTAGVYEDLGAEIGWTDGAGLYLRFYGEPGSTFGDGFVVLDRVFDNKHWTTFDPTGCKVTVTQNDAKGVSGKATCSDLRWADAMSSTVGPGFIDGEPAFDAEITFEAAP